MPVGHERSGIRKAIDDHAVSPCAVQNGFEHIDVDRRIVTHYGQHDRFRRNAVLVAVESQRVYAALFSRMQAAELCGVRGCGNDIVAVVDIRKSLFFRKVRIGQCAEIVRYDFAVRIGERNARLDAGNDVRPFIQIPFPRSMRLSGGRLGKTAICRFSC